MNTKAKSLKAAVLIWLMTILTGSPVSTAVFYLQNKGHMGLNSGHDLYSFIQSAGGVLLLIAVFSAAFSLPSILMNFLGLRFLDNRKNWGNAARILFLCGMTTLISTGVVMLFFGFTKLSANEVSQVIGAIIPFYLTALISTFYFRKLYRQPEENKIIETEEETY